MAKVSIILNNRGSLAKVFLEKEASYLKEGRTEFQKQINTITSN